MRFSLRNPFCVLGLVLLWRLLLLIFTAQPIPANDAFGYDGGVVNYLHTGHYCNPSLGLIFPITGHEVFSLYPPGYQAVLLPWMKAFGTSAISAMCLHFVLFALSAWLILNIVRKYFPAAPGYAPAVLLFFGITFGDRPEDLAYIFGLCSLWLVLRQISRVNATAADAAAISFLLLLMLYTSIITGAYFFGIGFIASAVAWWQRKRFILFVPFVLTAVLFAVITRDIASTEPRWWAGFMESARQQSVMTVGFHAPYLVDLIKLARNAPVFVLALALLPFVFVRRREIAVLADTAQGVWLFLLAGILVMGWVLLALDMTLLAANYVGYVLFTQILLAAGLLGLAPVLFPRREFIVRSLLVCCVVAVSIRALGMSTWGAVCAWENSYQQTQTDLQTELKPFAKSDAPVLVSSAYLYSAAEFGVKNAIHSDWYFDHANWTNNADVNGLIQVKPVKMVLTQFDYYRNFAPVLARLRHQTDAVGIRVLDLSHVRSPESIPSMQRVVQHISWAPVIVDLDWK